MVRTLDYKKEIKVVVELTEDEVLFIRDLTQNNFTGNEDNEYEKTRTKLFQEFNSLSTRMYIE